MNPFDILLIVLLAGVVLLAVRRLYRKRRQGGCGCGCSGCVNTACSGHNNTQRKGENP